MANSKRRRLVLVVNVTIRHSVSLLQLPLNTESYKIKLHRQVKSSQVKSSSL